MMEIKKASRSARFARILLMGGPGTGKTMTALRVATCLRHRLGIAEDVGVIDTEQNSSCTYAGIVADGLEIDPSVIDLSAAEGRYSPRNHLDALASFAAAGTKVLVLDSGSHAWAGPGGILEIKDRIAGNGNGFAAWSKVTPMQQQLIDALLSYPGHLIVTLRTKTQWVLEENDKGKQAPRMVGTEPVQREGMLYEFDLVLHVDPDHGVRVVKSRIPNLADAWFDRPGDEIARPVADWMQSRGPVALPTPIVTREAGVLRRLREATRDPEATFELLDAFGEERAPGKWIAVADRSDAGITKLASWFGEEGNRHRYLAFARVRRAGGLDGIDTRREA